MKNTDPQHLCPVCRRPVIQTRFHDINAHFDKAGRHCPASNRSWDITITGDKGRATP